MISFGDDFERLLITRRDKGAARFAFVKEGLLGDLVSLGMMANKDDFDVAVTGRDKLIEQEEEASSEILLHRVHRARGVHDAENGGVGILARVGFEMLVTEIVFMERMTLFSRDGCAFFG